MPTLSQVSSAIDRFYTSDRKYQLPLAPPTPAIDLCACASPSVWFPSPPPISGRLTRQHLVAVTLRNVYCYPLFEAPFFPQNLPHFCWEACLKPTNLENSSDIIMTEPVPSYISSSNLPMPPEGSHRFHASLWKACGQLCCRLSATLPASATQAHPSLDTLTDSLGAMGQHTDVWICVAEAASEPRGQEGSGL